MANEIVLTSREKERQVGRGDLVGGRVRKMEEKRMDVLKPATAERGKQDVR